MGCACSVAINQSATEDARSTRCVLHTPVERTAIRFTMRVTRNNITFVKLPDTNRSHRVRCPCAMIALRRCVLLRCSDNNVTAKDTCTERWMRCDKHRRRYPINRVFVAGAVDPEARDSRTQGVHLLCGNDALVYNTVR